jgi:ribosomal protein S18 acetylase RimI-like enzyme
MRIEKIGLNDVDQISRLHQNYMEKGFLSSLGTKFLGKLYEAMIKSKIAFCIVACDESRIVGFVSGTKNTGHFYKEFIRKYYLSVLMLLLPKVINLKNLQKMFETLFYPVKQEYSLPDAELLSIVVDEDYRGKGIGKDLFKKFLEEINSLSINKFKVVVGEELSTACRFYESVGCVLHSEIEVHRGKKSRVYVWGMK